MAMMEDGKMVVTKVLICGGLVVVVAYGIYACTYSLRRQRAALRSYNEVPASEHQHHNNINSNNNLVGSQVRILSILLFSLYPNQRLDVLIYLSALPCCCPCVSHSQSTPLTNFVTAPLVCIFRGPSVL